MSEAFILMDHMGLHILSHGDKDIREYFKRNKPRLLTFQSTIDAVQVELR